MYPIGQICQIPDRTTKQLILQLFQENVELRQRLDKVEHPDNIPEPLKVMGRRTVNPIYKSSKNEENIS